MSQTIEIETIETIETITAEQASRWAVVALTCDLEFWARTAAREGRVSLDDLIDTLDTIRQTGKEDAATTVSDVGSGFDHPGIAS